MDTKEQIPSWLYFPLSLPKFKISKENELLALKILKSLKQHAENNNWDIEKIISFNKYDSSKGYLIE